MRRLSLLSGPILYKACKPAFIAIILCICSVPVFQVPATADTPESSHFHLSVTLSPDEKKWIADHPVIRVAGPKAFPPFYFHDKNQMPKGIAADYTALIFKELGITIKTVPDIPWPDVLSKVNKNEVDLITCAAKTKTREEFLSFSDPYLSFPMIIITQKNAPFIAGINDLSGKTLACIKKVSTFEWLKRDKIHFHPSFVSTPLEGLKEVSVGRADAYIGNLATSSYLIERHGLSNLKIAAPTSYGNYNLHFASRKDLPVLTRIINKALSAMPPEQHAAIRSKWLSVRYEHGFQIHDIILWVLGVAAISLIVVFTIMMWNRRLKDEIKHRLTTEVKLKESEERFRTLHKASFGGILIHDKGTILDANQGLSDLSGYSMEELVGMDALTLVAPEWRDMVLNNINSGYESPYDAKGLKKNGNIYPVELRNRRIPYKNKTVRVTECRDISERIKSQDERDQLIERLKDALEKVKALNGLLPICSHCKKIRDDSGYWNQLEAYIEKHADVLFSHGLCPECVTEIYGEEDWFKNEMKKS